MSAARRTLPPSSSLPAIRSLNDQPEASIFSALSDLHALYCPLPTSLAFQTHLTPKDPPAAADSGYASDNEEEKEDDDGDGLELRDDPYERGFAERWLTSFLGRAEELTCFESEESQQYAIDKASCVLASFFAQAEEEDVEDTEITRDYQFTLKVSPDETEKLGKGVQSEVITVQLTDGLAGRDNADHTDVGLQSWGAAFIFTELMCTSPAHFNFARYALGSGPRIIELGAGTGLAGIALAKVLPRLGVSQSRIIATDFHPTVLANLEANILKNFPTSGDDKVSATIQAAPLDWETPDLSSPLDEQADILIATDVIYGPEHAVWLRDCAARLLKPDGVFWLMSTVRTTGKFEGISETVRAAFNGRDGIRNPEGCVLTILGEERFARPSGIGRGDESEYRLFRIGWAS